MIEFLNALKETENVTTVAPSFEIVRLIIVPILSLITAAMAISVFSATYFIVFRIKKYLKKHKNYLSFTQKLLTSIDSKNVSIFRAFDTTMWGPNLVKNKKLIGTVLTQYKNSDLKDLILGTYNDELNSIKNIINKDSKLIKNNQHFIQFQRLFHTYRKDGIIIEYLDNDYISFYKVRKSGVIIGIIEKQKLKEMEIDFKYEIDYSEIFATELQEIASIYKIYFIKRNFLYKNISNPNLNFEEKLSNIKKQYNKILQKKYSHYNVYMKDQFKDWSKLNKQISNGKYSIDGDFLLEHAAQQKINIDNIFSEKIKVRKEIKEVINKKNQEHKKSTNITKK